MNIITKAISSFMAFLFLFTVIIPPSFAQMISLPVPGAMVTASVGYAPAIVKGITIYPENPLQFDFIVDSGEEHLQGEALKNESNKLIKYFLASLTVPEKETWVNLSPYEKNRIIPESFGSTEMGRDLLAQDYILKQLTASLMYPEKELGKKFWDNIYARAKKEFNATDIPVDTFNKVWIVPSKAVVYEHGNSAFVVDAKLKVMLAEDYENVRRSLATQERGGLEEDYEALARSAEPLVSGLQSSVSDLIRSVIIPEIEKEVNEGKNFANLRQIYHSMILAAWFKKNLKESLLGKVYVDQNKVTGLQINQPVIPESFSRGSSSSNPMDSRQKIAGMTVVGTPDQIYNQYLQAFQKGVYNYIKEEYDPQTHAIIPKKYFSGGFDNALLTEKVLEEKKDQALLTDSEKETLPKSNVLSVNVRLFENQKRLDRAMISGRVISDPQQLAPVKELAQEIHSKIMNPAFEIIAAVEPEQIVVGKEKIFKDRIVTPDMKKYLNDRLNQIEEFMSSFHLIKEKGIRAVLINTLQGPYQVNKISFNREKTILDAVRALREKIERLREGEIIQSKREILQSEKDHDLDSFKSGLEGIMIALNFLKEIQEGRELEIFTSDQNVDFFDMTPPTRLEIEQRRQKDQAMITDLEAIEQKNKEDQPVILLVDDNNITLKLVGEMLQDYGYNVRFANDGRDALDLLNDENNKIGLAWTDFDMPGMNGDALIDEMSKNVLLSKIPIILWSGEPGIVEKMKEKIDAFAYPLKYVFEKGGGIRDIFDAVKKLLPVEKDKAMTVSDKEWQELKDMEKNNQPGRSIVLIVDDEGPLLTMLGEFLQEKGYNVIFAENGKKALERVEKEKVDMIWTDMEMPEMAGDVLVNRVSQDERFSKIPMVVWSGNATKVNEMRDKIGKPEAKSLRLVFGKPMRNFNAAIAETQAIVPVKKDKTSISDRDIIADPEVLAPMQFQARDLYNKIFPKVEEMKFLNEKFKALDFEEEREIAEIAKKIGEIAGGKEGIVDFVRNLNNDSDDPLIGFLEKSLLELTYISLTESATFDIPNKVGILFTYSSMPNFLKKQNYAIDDAIQYLEEILKFLNNLASAKEVTIHLDKNGKGYFSYKDFAMTTETPVGGIDLNSALMDLQIKRDGDGVALPLQFQPVENMKIDGFLPVIINIKPVENIQLLLGFIQK